MKCWIGSLDRSRSCPHGPPVNCIWGRRPASLAPATPGAAYHSGGLPARGVVVAPIPRNALCKWQASEGAAPLVQRLRGRMVGSVGSVGTVAEVAPREMTGED